MFPVLLLCRHSVHWPFFHSWHRACKSLLQGLCTCCPSDWDSFPRLAPSCQSGLSSKNIPSKKTSHVLVQNNCQKHTLPPHDSLSHYPALLFFTDLITLCNTLLMFSLLFFKKQTSIFYTVYKSHVRGNLFCLDHLPLYLQGIFGTHC